MKTSKLFITLFALMLCMGALFFATTAYASDGSDAEPLSVESGSPNTAPQSVESDGSDTEALSVDAVWLEGDILNIEVTDKQTGVNQTLEVSLTEYAGNSEYVSVQAVDNNGNKSNTIQFKNPYYTPNSAPVSTANPAQSESAVPDGSKPLTPDGTGTVADNVTDGDGKEFFTITTEDGNVFYMIIDRQRSTENVYLLNAVTEDDLAVLAEKSGSNGTSQSGIPSQTTPPQTTEPPDTAASPEPSEPPTNNGGLNNNTIIFVVIGAVVVGSIGYYFKILRPKKNAAAVDEAEDYEDDADDYGDGDDEYSEDGDRE